MANRLQTQEEERKRRESVETATPHLTSLNEIQHQLAFVLGQCCAHRIRSHSVRRTRIEIFTPLQIKGKHAVATFS